jgi:hypothetical protein
MIQCATQNITLYRRQGVRTQFRMRAPRDTITRANNESVANVKAWPDASIVLLGESDVPRA